MALYDDLIRRLDLRARDPGPTVRVDGHAPSADWGNASRIIAHLQGIIRDYNPDHEIFDDEKRGNPT